MEKVQEFLDKHNLLPSFERKLTKYELTKITEILEGKRYKGQNNWISYFYGLYNYYEKKKNDIAKKYYLISISHGNAFAMNSLDILFLQIKKQYYEVEYAKTVQFYITAIEKGDVNAMNSLGYIYMDYYRNIDKAVKYYLLAITSSNSESSKANIMNNLRKIPDKELYPQLIKYPESKEAKQIISDLIKDRDILLIHNKLQTCVRKGKCSICYMADGTDLILSSCYFHSFCVECSLKIDKCALCRVC